MNFPAEVSTNSYALEGSSDIAYAICVLAKTSNHGTSDASRAEPEVSQSRGIERLRSAENELRRARVLVSLDKTRGELFTFYRKEDLQRDAKSIFNRVVNILRKNECQMLSKNAIKTADMLRPDRGKLHRLFVYALLCMINSAVSRQDQNIISLGLNTFLVQSPTSQVEEQQFGDTWGLLDLSVQLLPSGKVIAISHQDNSALFKRLSSISQKERIESFLSKPGKVLLALTGQYARYMGGYVGKLPHSLNVMPPGARSPLRTREATLQMFRQQVWKTSVERWLAENEFGSSVEEDDWIEVEVPLGEIEPEHPISPNGFAPWGKISWKQMFWPTSLCFVDATGRRPTEGIESLAYCFDDPLQFVEDWMSSAADRQAAIRKSEQDVEMSSKSDQVEDPDFSNSNNVNVDAGQSFRRITSIDGQVPSTIYPTPPDGMLSQITPGVFPVDGLAVTPADGGVAGQADSTANNVEIMDLGGVQAAIGSGLYDEDLFEDGPGEKFVEAEMAEEPNWDFFDEPDADMAENADQMDLDISEKASFAESGDQALHHDQIERTNTEATRVLAVTQDVQPPEPEASHVSESTIFTEGRLAKVDEQISMGPVGTQTKLADHQIQPLSPIEVRKRLFPDMASPETYAIQKPDGLQPNRRSLLRTNLDSTFFQPDLKVTDRRYSANGFFWFEAEKEGQSSAAELKSQHLNLPRIGIPKKEKIDVVPETPGGSEPPSSSPSAQDTNFDSSDFFSDSNKHGSPIGSNEDETGSPAVSPKPADDILDPETENEVREEVVKFLELLRPEIDESSFARNHYPLQRNFTPKLSVTPDRLVIVAQVIVDQVSQTFFQYFRSNSPQPASEARDLDIVNDLQLIYGDATELSLGKFAEVSTSTPDAAEGSWLAESSSPFIRLSRSDTIVDALATIQPFWETLGLQPVSGRKDITALCIHPVGKHIEEGSSAFLQRFGEVYSNCNLGNHSIGDLGNDAVNGLIAWDARKDSTMLGLLAVCKRLGSSLATLPSSAENVVVYIVNPFDDRKVLVDICDAFVALFTNCAKACGKNKCAELNLQILPISFIASPDTVVIPSQAEYLSLALEVYNRCHLISPSGEIAESGAAVTLAKLTPKNITFNLVSDATSPLSKDGEVLHLAYSQSVDLRWLTACWTDNLGKIALTMTYCLRHRGSSVSRPRSEVIKEMWEISQDIMTNTRGKWRLLVAHNGTIEPDEINEWCFLANQNAPNNNVSHCALTILTFDEHPSVQFSSPTPQIKPPPPSAAAIAPGKYGTPVSTPSAAVMTSSPEQFTASTPMPPTPGASGLLTAPTPPDQSSQTQPHGFDMTADPDATLVDPTDDCWSLLLPFGLNNSPSPLESRPALLSGFLLKRRGPLDSDGLVALGVNLVSSTETGKAEQQALLRDVIGQWRGLYTLARTKSLAGSGTVLPWHVRTAVVGCRAVSELL